MSLGFLCDNLPLTINIPLLTELKCPPLKVKGGRGDFLPQQVGASNKTFSPEDRLRGLSPRELIKYLSPEKRRMLKKLLEDEKS